MGYQNLDVFSLNPFTMSFQLMCEWKFIVLCRSHGTPHQVYVSNWITLKTRLGLPRRLNPFTQVYVSNQYLIEMAEVIRMS